jgi:hypothetical protein
VVNIITIPPAMIETGAGSPATAPALTASGVRASTTAMTASALITKINSQAPRADNVIVVSTWDRETGKPLGYKANGEGTNFVLKPGMGCQVYVKQDMTLTLP